MRITTTTPASDHSGWTGGVLTFSGRGSTMRTLLRLDAVIGRPDGYDTAPNARIAAALLTSGAEHAAAAIAQDGDGRYRLYAASFDAFDGAGQLPLAFEFGRPRTPSGAVLDTWIFSPADGLVEVRDGTKQLFPYG